MVSLLTALTIKANPTEVKAYGPSEGKYGFEIYSIIRDKYRPHLTSEAIFDSQEIAKEKGQEVLNEIKNFDLTKQKKELSDNLGESA